MYRRSSTLLVLGSLLAGSLATGCSFLFTFETVPEGAGGSGASGGSGGGGAGAGTTGPAGGNGGTTTMPACVDPATDCPAPSSECRVFSCEGGECVEGDVAEGGPAATQVLGDCVTYVCTGGQILLEIDDTDVLDDGTSCTDNTCSGGVAGSNFAAAGAACTDAGGAVCDGAGTCVECLTNDECLSADEPLCIKGACGPATCRDAMQNGDETDLDCGGLCVGCDVGKMCGGLDGNCLSGLFCDPSSLLCTAPKVDGSPCAGANECAGALCVDGVCCAAACDGFCQACNLAGAEGTCAYHTSFTDPDSECEGELTCDGAGQCNKDFGQACAANEECASGYCVDGVCCTGPCSGSCETCARLGLGTFGICDFIPAGTDPEQECPGQTTCNGSGLCE